MKEIVEKLFSEKRTELTEALTQKAGFNAAEAGSFLPGIKDKLMSLIGDGSLDLSKLTDLSALKSKFDLSSLGAAAGVDEEKAGAGLGAVLETLKGQLGSQLGGLSGALGGAGKLFGR